MAFLPAIPAWVGIAAGVAGAAVSGLSAFGQAQYQSQVAKNNAAIASANADRVAQAAQIKQQRSDREAAVLQGQQLAAQAASGMDVLGASELAVRGLSKRVQTEGALDIRQQGEAQTQQLQQDAANYQGQAAAASASGTGALIGAGLNMVSAAVPGVPSSMLGSIQSKKYPWMVSSDWRG